MYRLSKGKGFACLFLGQGHHSRLHLSTEVTGGGSTATLSLTTRVNGGVALGAL